MSSFYSVKWEKYFYYILSIQLLIKYRKNILVVVHIVTHNGGNDGNIHRSLRYCIQNFETFLKNMKI